MSGHCRDSSTRYPATSPTRPRAAIAARHPEEYEAAIDKEHTAETAIREKLIEDLPLVIYPGSAPSSPDGSPLTHIRVHSRNLKLSLYFTDPIAQSSIKRVLESPSPHIGVMYSRDCNGRRQGIHGFVATAVRAQPAKHGAICVRLHTQHEFSIVGTVRREPDGAMAGRSAFMICHHTYVYPGHRHHLGTSEHRPPTEYECPYARRGRPRSRCLARAEGRGRHRQPRCGFEACACISLTLFAARRKPSLPHSTLR